MAQKPSPTQQENIRLRRAKKMSVATSTASGALGVAALGALGASRVRPGRAISPATAARIKRAGDSSTVPLSAASLGVGGIGSLNFARVQNQEANRLPKWDRKTGRVVMPKKNVSKALSPRALGSAAKTGKVVGSSAGPRTYQRDPSGRFSGAGQRMGQAVRGAAARRRETPQQAFERRAATGAQPTSSVRGSDFSLGGRQGVVARESYGRRGNWAYNPSSVYRERAGTVGANGRNPRPITQTTYGRQRGSLTPMGEAAAWTAGYTGVGAALGVANHKAKQKEKAAAARRKAARQARAAQPQTVGKSLGMDFGLSSVNQGQGNIELVAKKDWKNISEHQRRAADARRTRRGGKSVAAAGGTAIGMTAALAATRGRSQGTQTLNALRGLNNAGRNFGAATKLARRGGADGALGRNLQRGAVNQAGRTLRANPYGTATLAGAGAMGVGAGMSTAGYLNEKSHNRAIARQRKARVKKAYDPEATRQKRMDGYSTALGALAGASGMAAVGPGRKAGAHLSGYRRQGQVARNTRGAVQDQALRLKSIQGRKALQQGGKAGALGAAALGAAVGASKVSEYKRGAGRPYNTRTW